MRFVETIVCVATLSSAAYGRVSAEEENDPGFDDVAWGTTAGQDEFDEIPLLPENSDVPPPVIPVTHGVVKIGQIYSVPYAQSVEKINDEPEEKDDDDDDDLMDRATGVSLVFGGTLLSLAALATVAMAGKALLLASGAMIIACLSGGAWPTWAGGTRESSDGAQAFLRGPYGDERGHFFAGVRRRDRRNVPRDNREHAP